VTLFGGLKAKKAAGLAAGGPSAAGVFDGSRTAPLLFHDGVVVSLDHLVLGEYRHVRVLKLHLRRPDRQLLDKAAGAGGQVEIAPVVEFFAPGLFNTVLHYLRVIHEPKLEVALFQVVIVILGEDLLDLLGYRMPIHDVLALLVVNGVFRTLLRLQR